MQTLNIAIQPEMLKKVRGTANARGISVSEYVRELIRKGIKNGDAKLPGGTNHLGVFFATLLDNSQKKSYNVACNPS